MSGYTVRPVSDRTLFTGKHQRSAFDTPWTTTERLLLAEVRHLRGRDLVVEVDVREDGIRLDGKLYANAKVASPGVRVAFDSMHGPLVYGTDRFTTWQDNVRAVALGLEALRKVDRYGITKRGEQYTGWKALPSGSPAIDAPAPMTVDEAWSIIGSFGEGTIEEQRRVAPEGLARAHRKARSFSHPDRHEGDQSLWDQVEQAAALLGVTQ